MNKKIFSFVLAGVITVSSMITCFATGQQNDPYFGLPYQPDQLGEYTANGFLYSSEPFTDMYAKDKGLIPSPVKNTYKAPSTWAKDEVIEASKMNLNNMEIITGYQGEITRAEFAKLMVQAYLKYAWQATEVNKYIPADWENDIFTDISSVTNKDYITWAAYLDITNGTGDGKFNPNKKITREEMATMLYRYILIFKKSFSYDSSVAKNYSDDNQLHSWSKIAVRTLSNREIIKGYPGNLFKPAANATREESLLFDLRANKEFVDPQVNNNLSAPSNAVVSGNTLYWNAVNNAQTYNIYKVKKLSNTEFEYEYYNRTNTTTFNLSDLNKHSGTYYFAIQAFNEFHMSPISNIVTVVVPNEVDAASILFNDGTNTLSWTTPTGATSYKVQVTGINYSTEFTTTSTSKILTGLPAGTFNVYITAYKNDFYSATTSKVLANTAP